MKRFLFSCLLTLMVTALQAGRELKLKDITDGVFRAESMPALHMLADGQSYAQLSDDRRRIEQYSMLTGKRSGVLLNLDKVRSVRQGETGKVTADDAENTTAGDGLDGVRIDDYQMSPDGRYVLVETGRRPIYRHSRTAVHYVYDVGRGSLTPLSAGGPQQTPLFSPDGKLVAFVRDNNIFVADLRDGSEWQVTADGVRNSVINGIPDWVNEEEFGNDRAMVFTADGRYLVWVRYDETAVPQYSMPLFKGLAPERKEFCDYPGAYTYKYPVAGAANAVQTLWSYDLRSGLTRQLHVPLDADGYIPRLTTTEADGEIAVCTMNRRQDCLRVWMVGPERESCRMVIEEQVPLYVKEEAVSGLRFTSRHILLPSDRSGYMHLYLYDYAGRLVRQIEDGDYEVSAVYGYDEATGSTYFASHEGGATGQRVWVVSGDGTKVCLTPQLGWNSASFAVGFRYFIHEWSRLDTPPVVTLCDSNGRLVATCIDNAALRARLADYRLGSRELFRLTTSEGIELNGWMVKPADFDASRRYPVIMYQYGGPGSQQVADRWGIGMCGQGAVLEQLFCQQGYVCVCVDNRGTGGRGADFEKCTYQRLGQKEAFDQVEAALWLSQQPYVDSTRIAIWGWSYGGFNTLMSMSEGRPVFRCGIAIAPPTSWRYYDTVYTERFMRTPRENPEGYDDCPIARADQLHGALLLCHGMADDNVHFRNTAEYTEALVQADKDFRQLVYTNRNHSIYGGNTRHHLFRQCLDFFNEHLGNR